ncbi:hypothetical protein [Umezawaea tangerina]|uniref:YbaB/EbfC DNA-binding family protein n=1 Tax=Umezawaea tangerina TaxID=84725 RepID=A0A2T0TLE6_9PSEU|nr:hypothetical protein [Umezawaea tangerina]PRY46467.1 hypothetical protein CLV43_101743 [Umezawaea tangerina]
MSDRWGFEEADDWESEAPAPQRTTEALVGRHAPVTVTVTPDAEVLSVHLTDPWRAPRTLATAAARATNEAVVQALAWQAEHPSPTAAPVPGTTETPITPEDALRLLAAVSADLAEFTKRTTEAATPTVRSAGGHVTAVGRAGQVVQVTIDPAWLNTARASEVESELLDALRTLRRRTAVDRPESGAIAELTSLLHHPDALLRRVGLTS